METTGWTTVGGLPGGVDTTPAYHWTNSTFLDAGVDSNSVHRRMPDPHMMCLKLGKRYYCDGDTESSTTGKRGKPPSSPAPRCQVYGCHVSLGNVKQYYRRHKVCEIHSKAPNVVVSGLLQRFCQQCSRFHGVTEFDEAKRSCRRRLKGHNQRRRKGTLSKERRHGPLPPSRSPSNPGCAFSLLSSSKTEPWNSSGDLSSRCSAALYELIAANRATYVSRHFVNQNDYSVSGNVLPDTQMWDRFGQTMKTTTTTVDLRQGPALEVGLLSMNQDPEEWTGYCL